MKKFLLLLFIAGSFVMTGCETTREISLNKDNSGTLTTTTDMSGMIGMAKMSGPNKEMDSLNEVIDTTLSLDKMADSLNDLTNEEKALVKKGKIGLQMNMPEDKCIIKIEFAFSNPAQINKLDKLSSKLVKQTIKKQLAAASENSTLPGMPRGDMPEGSVEDYFIMTYSKGMIEKKLNKERYANVKNDEAMSSLKQMSEMGMGKSTLIINLPRPVKKTGGKNIKLSVDKRKVTITSELEDFFDDATALEFKIEY